MRYFYDTEFIEDGKTIELISIGVVAEDGREFYAVSNEFDMRKANKWVRENVIPKLPNPSDACWISKKQIRENLEIFFSWDKNIELWAWVGAYDHVVLCQLWGDMTKLPSYMPRFTNELKQLWIANNKPLLPKVDDSVHSALADAKTNFRRWEIINA